MVGQVVEKSDAAFKSLEGEKRSYRNTENGKGRIEYILPVKEEAARLLKELKPEGGWPTLASAILALEQPLADFINANRITVVKNSNIPDLLGKNWRYKDEIVKRAWLSSKREKK
ncbi:hypothetical protein D3C81_987460 [compost metagenome]